MTHYCSVCMKPSKYMGHIFSSEEQFEEIFDGSYCGEHVIQRLKLVIEFLEKKHIGVITK